MLEFFFNIFLQGVVNIPVIFVVGPDFYRKRYQRGGSFRNYYFGSWFFKNPKIGGGNFIDQFAGFGYVAGGRYGKFQIYAAFFFQVVVNNGASRLRAVRNKNRFIVAGFNYRVEYIYDMHFAALALRFNKIADPKRPQG